MTAGIAPRTGIAAARTGRTQIHHPSQDWTRQCQFFVRWECFGVGPGAGTAHQAWLETPSKHRERPENAPYGTAGYLHGPPGSAGHAIFMLGGGRCLSNDIVTTGRISVTTVAMIEDKWHYVWDGWTEHVNQVRIWGHGPSMSARAIREAQAGDHVYRNGSLLKHELASAAGSRHGMDLSSDRVGRPMQEAVKAVQHNLGFRRTGLVGPSLLAYLADRRSAFTARP